MARFFAEFLEANRCPNPCPKCGAHLSWLYESCPACGNPRDVRAAGLLPPGTYTVVPSTRTREPERDEMHALVGETISGAPYARVEPQWREGHWFISAPADLKNIETRDPTWNFCFEKVDRAVAKMGDPIDEWGNVQSSTWETLPDPGHWKQDRDCPIS